MNSKTFKFLGCVALSFIFAIASHAQSVSSTPVGYVTQTISGSTGGRSLSLISLPLYSPATVSNSTGTVSAVTSTGFSVSGASFATLSDVASPYAVRMTSGNAEGANFLISANTADTLTFDLSSSSMGNTNSIAIGDSYELVEIDTLSSLFGDPSDGVVFGAASQSSPDVDADIIYIYASGAWKTYFHNGTNWVTRQGRSYTNQDNYPLTSDTTLLFSRINSSSTSYVLTGTVPSTNSILKINAAGISFLANNTPSDITLSQLNLNSLSDFANGTSGVDDSADSIYLYNAGAWKRYQFNGTNWITRQGRGTTNSDDIVLSAGSAFLFAKANAGSEQNAVLNLQYTL